MKIYTKTGDCGTTGLFAGPRVDKDHPRIQAYGSVDELCAVLGVVIEALPIDDATATADHLRAVQSDLFSIGAELATPDPAAHGLRLLAVGRVEFLEAWIDRLDEQLEPLSNFILPGGSPASTRLHWARTVCRRAERDVVQLSHHAEVQDCSLVVIYLNRLSDLLFVLARAMNSAAGIPDTPWQRPS